MYLNKLTNKSLYIYEKYRDNIFIRFILNIFSLFYFAIYKLRLILYKLNILKSKSLNAIVISIGNITTGGTGKTPIVIETANYLLNKGYKVAVLSRGYKRKIINNNDALLVSDGNDIVADQKTSGDEPFLIAKKAPKAIVIVGKDRIKTGLSAIKLGADVLILDDGYQHIKLNRNENLLLLDGTKPFDNGRLLPGGKLRELPDSIKRASAIIISNSDKSTEDEIKKHTINKPTIFMKYKIRKLTGINIKKTINIEEMKGQKVIAFCGIANPGSFLKSLEENNITVTSHLTFPDHHDYTVSDIEEIIKLAQNNKIENIITTEKDGIKVEELSETVPMTLWNTVLEIQWETTEPFEKMFRNETISKTNPKHYQATQHQF